VFAEEPVFILRQNSILKDENLDKKSFKQGEKFTFKYTKKGLGVDIGEATSTQVLTVMAAGTNAKILSRQQATLLPLPLTPLLFFFDIMHRNNIDFKSEIN